MSVVEDKLKILPTDPGVYIMKDDGGHVIYVGKAKNLKNRVRQYFFNTVKTEKVMAMVSHIKDFDYIIVNSEIDALSLENNLIKKYKPKYNILLKDDKTYPYIKVNLKEKFPYFYITRKIKKDGGKYFGPFMGGINAQEVLELVNLTYKLRPCSVKITEKPKRECLNYHIGKCLSPCSGRVSEEDYMKSVNAALDFLSGGDDSRPEEILKEAMLRHAENEEFEAALACRERLKSLEKLKVKRITALNRFIDADVISMADNGLSTVFSMLNIRKGRMLGAKNLSEENVYFDKSEGLADFITGYYKNAAEIPSEIIVFTEPADTELLETYLTGLADKKISVTVPVKGVRKQLVDMAGVNAEDYLKKSVERIRHKTDMTINACQKLQRVLNLSKYPKRMECYDISHISGVDKVGSMVVFTDGEKDAAEYRRFKIKTVEGNNDFESLKEVLKRRLSKLGTDEEEKFPKPDLIIIDGGKGQLSSVKQIFDELNVKDIDLVSLAKQEEEVFTLHSDRSVLIDKSDYALRLLQRIRDEAHRFAITFNRSLRGKRSLVSVLDGIDGVGKVKKKALLEKFKDLSGIMNAKKEDLMTVDGIGEALADEIIAELKKENITI
ncbi:MAG TPA: excinuclease ABC subunit C [Clostridiales bacterium]|nr:excinuclease ABC subunit C [Clostridiales bacterium]